MLHFYWHMAERRPIIGIRPKGNTPTESHHRCAVQWQPIIGILSLSACGSKATPHRHMAYKRAIFGIRPRCNPQAASHYRCLAYRPPIIDMGPSSNSPVATEHRHPAWEQSIIGMRSRGTAPVASDYRYMASLGPETLLLRNLIIDMRPSGSPLLTWDQKQLTLL